MSDLDALIERYFEMMRSRPSLEDLARFTMAIPPELHLKFLGWLRVRASQLEAMGLISEPEVLN